MYMCNLCECGYTCSNTLSLLRLMLCTNTDFSVRSAMHTNKYAAQCIHTDAHTRTHAAHTHTLHTHIITHTHTAYTLHTTHTYNTYIYIYAHNTHTHTQHTHNTPAHNSYTVPTRTTHRFATRSTECKCTTTWVSSSCNNIKTTTTRNNKGKYWL